MKFVSTFGNDKEVSDEIFLARLRYWRDQELKATDWTQLADTPVDTVAWAEYRQALRNLPSLIVNNEVDLPIKPGGN